MLDVLQYAMSGLATSQEGQFGLTNGGGLEKGEVHEESLSQIITGPASFTNISGVQ